MKQFIFQKDYTDALYKKVKQNDFSAYHIDKFDYDKEATFSTDIERRDDLLTEMLKYATPQQDYEAAITLFEAFPDLTREQATYLPFWAYLTHVDLYPYMIKRFCEGKEPSDSDIKINWWHGSLMRKGLSNLWWSVKQTIDESNPEDKYHYTKYFFKHLDFRQRRLGASTLFRHHEAVIGILKFLEVNITDYFEGRSNFIIMYFNKQATLRQLAICNRDDFYNELLSIKDDILNVRLRTEAADALSSQDDKSWDTDDDDN
jgi:hypothetical protein